MFQAEKVKSYDLYGKSEYKPLKTDRFVESNQAIFCFYWYMIKIGKTLHTFFKKILGSEKGWQKEKPCTIEIQSGRAFKFFIN